MIHWFANQIPTSKEVGNMIWKSVDCHPITFDERVSVDLDTAEIQPCLRFLFFLKRKSSGESGD